MRRNSPIYSTPSLTRGLLMLALWCVVAGCSDDPGHGAIGDGAGHDPDSSSSTTLPDTESPTPPGVDVGPDAPSTSPDGGPGPDPKHPDTGPPPSTDPLDWFDPKPPLAATPHDEWNFVPVEGAVCANGDQSGFFYNHSDTSDDLLIFLLGGGICYDEKSCAVSIPLIGSMNGDPQSWWMNNGERHGGVFQRGNNDNPFKDASYVVLPHCTVDFHTANKTSTYASTGTIQQRGYRNIQLAMNHVVPTFTNTNANITVAGFSAGGVGTLANYHQIALAFESYGHQPPFLVNDSGPVQTREYFSLNSHNAIRNGWDLQNTIETWCETCAAEGYHEALYWIHQLHPGVRSSQICAYGDMVVIGLYGLFDVANTLRFQIEPIPNPPFSYTTMKPGLNAYRDWSESFPTQGMHRNLFYHRGDRHGALTVAPLHEDHTPAIVPFLRAQMNRNDPHWFSPHF